MKTIDADMLMEKLKTMYNACRDRGDTAGQEMVIQLMQTVEEDTHETDER